MPVAIVEEVVRKLGGPAVLGSVVRSQADLALAVQNRLPLTALKGLSKAGLSEQEIERFVIPQRTRRHRAEKNQSSPSMSPIEPSVSCASRRSPKKRSVTTTRLTSGYADG